jgi:hypothetical protein
MINATLILEDNIIVADCSDPTVGCWILKICDNATGTETELVVSSYEFASLLFMSLYNEEYTLVDDQIKSSAEDEYSRIQGTCNNPSIFRTFS